MIYFHFNTILFWANILLRMKRPLIKKIKKSESIVTKRIQGKVVNTRSVLVEFMSQIPEGVYLGYEKKKVVEFKPQVMRCFQCQRFGHSSVRCNSKPRCPTCGEAHKWESCPNKTDPKCANCGGSHSAAYQGCPKYRIAKNIQTIKNNEKLSFAEATKKYLCLLNQ